MSDKLTLTITAGPNAGKTLTFEEHDTLLFGRANDCQICLPADQQVSRHHFLLEVNPPDARLRDLGSRNGTFINGQKCGGRARHETPEEGARREYPQVDLHHGNKIKVGQTLLQVQVETMPEPVPEEPARGSETPEGLPRDQQAAVLADYEMGALLGEGGMGAVYLAKHKQNGEHVAVKVMRSKVRVSEQVRQQFLREIETTRALRHPQLVRFLGSGSEDNMFYFLLEYCEGGSVAGLVKRRGGRLDLEEARPILLQALNGLAYLHAQGFVHRDLKPQNILLSGRGKPWSTKISDLGLAKSFEQAGLSGMTATGSYAGSFPFMPREQVINFKRVQPASDVWAMGATCYTILTGAYPRELRPGQDPLLAILQETCVPIRQRTPSIPAGIADVIDRSLATEESERYQHAGEMYEALLSAWKEGREQRLRLS